MPRTRLLAVSGFVCFVVIAAPAYVLKTLAINLRTSPPVAVNDSYTVHGGSLLTPLQNDSAFGQSIHIQSFTQPAHGSVSFYTFSILSYGAQYGYVGPDSFNYTVCNTQSECATATISINVVNQPPTTFRAGRMPRAITLIVTT